MSSSLFSPLTLRGVAFANRIMVAPMCQYSAVDGTVGDWHLMHLGQFAISGAGLVMVEATGVEAIGRITPDCVGLYSDQNEAALDRVIRFCRDHGDAKYGIQLGHAGRKGSTVAPWRGGGPIEPDQGPWAPPAPSAVPYLPNWETPVALDEKGLARVRQAFVDAAKRARRIGFELVELHMAHGYLLHQFLSPLSNRRNDAYGGNLDGRMRFPLEVFEAVRAVWPRERPLIIRVSATDWADGGWDLEQTITFAGEIKAIGCDAIHVTSGGLVQDQKIEVGPGYQTHFAAEIRRRVEIPTIAVGQITEAVQAETIVKTGQADMVAMARGLLYDPRWVWKAAATLGAEATFPPQYARANPAMRGQPFVKR